MALLNLKPNSAGYSRGFIILLGVLQVASWLVTPLAVLVSLNLLFKVGIAYTLWTWLAASILLNVGTDRFISAK